MAGRTTKIFDMSGVPQGIRFDLENAQVMNLLRNYYIHTGKMFYFGNFDRITGAGTKKYLLMLIPVMEDGSNFDIHVTWRVNAGAEFEVVTYVNPTITNLGTKINPGNKNGRFQDAVHYVQLYEDGTFSGLGTRVLGDVIGIGKSNEAGQESIGGFVLPGGYNYVMEFNKISAQEGWISWYFEWVEKYEGTPHAITTTTTTSTTTSTTTVP